MITVTQQLSKKEEKQIYGLLQSLSDSYSDFYITKDNLRLYIKENFDVLLDNLKHGDTIVYCNDGMIILVGWADKSKRKYIKILAKDNKTITNLLKVVSWHARCELFVKIKRNNTIKIALLKSNFVFAGGRGKEVLLSRKPNKYFNIKKQLNKE